MANPVVIIDVDKFKLWYTGNNGYKYQIGFLEALNPLGFIQDINNPNPPQLAWNFSPSEQGIEHPFVVVSNTKGNDKKYEIWFNNRYFVGSDLRFDIYYSSSTDSAHWKTPPEIISFNENSDVWWDTRGRGVPSVIYDDDEGKYHMWFTARANDGVWRIGYASSSDGKSWQRYVDPVLVAQPGWESDGNIYGVGNAYVFKENNLYHMFYVPGKYIGYAISSDGKTWTRSSDNPILHQAKTNLHLIMFALVTLQL